MLLLLILVHLISKNSSAAPPPHPLDARSSTDSCDDINNCRQLFDIVWGCLATIFACTWVSVHPNVPPPDQSWLALFWRRLRMMLFGIIAPEIMAGFAIRQFLGVRRLSKEYGFSQTHGFFFIMGGFVSSIGNPVTTEKQLKDQNLGPQFQKMIRHVNAEDIMDKSKGDALSKGIALAQGLWFIAQCAARVHQHLAVMELEVATLAFAVVNTFIWVLWWNKPLGVQRPIVIGPPQPADAVPIILPPSELFGTAIFGSDSVFNYDPLSSTSVPSFWSLPLEDYGEIPMGPMWFTAFIGTLFGAIHCAAWNADFPSTTEMWMWRVFSPAIAAIPALITFLMSCNDMRDDLFDGMMLYHLKLEPLSIVVYVGIPIYIAARLILIALPFAALRSLPPSAFMDVNWSRYIPHI
ncbi:hypothetical protein K438DRAFT_1934657 [Mycena galopus ATCC 62051]|nr:hypothetical protein K438DRAFT_1934657 [Mycena galopus ATCC 62051]